MAQLFFLGTGAALPTAQRANTALALLPDASAPGVLIDCGGEVFGALQRAGAGPDSVADLLITHAHIDHIGGLASLIESLRLAGRQQPLRILALPPALEIAQRLVSLYAYELTLQNWPFPITFEPVRNDQRLTLAGVDALILEMDHALPSVGVRFAFPGGDLAYTCDTQPTPNALTLGHGARTFITECTFLHADVAHARSSKHTTAFEAGQEAHDCGVGALALVHIGVGDALSAVRAEVAQSFSGELLIPNDGDTLTV